MTNAWTDRPIRRLEDLPEATIRLMNDYGVAASGMTGGRHDWRIPGMVANAWATHGRCVFNTREFARRYGSTRRTVNKAIKRLVAAGAIRHIGRTADKRPILVPVLEVGAMWRAGYERRANGH
ncbi:helix-turn-helix domain-containing protein [Aurantimonas coralicida]|uniref:helix-turn-helix domain-containing protein n=1 Tax=Aurantimonas coralicida TaxID=182270 RepID=UPI001E62DDED|nr:helix-turn-helix domain-containing protein [Aurantimonas coralicida]MCD1642459.1 helix-turn-helix domain-containing protein [Aurantimonas coralicida]